mgnify:FL=1
MSEFTIKKYTNADQQVWDAFVSQNTNTTFLFFRDFIEYHKHLFVDYSLMVFKKNKIIAILPAHIHKKTVNSHQGLTYGGLISDPKLRFQERLSCCKIILKYLKDNAIKTLNLKFLPDAYQIESNQSLEYILHKIKAKCNQVNMLSVVKPKHKKYSKDRIAGNKRGLINNLHIKEEDNLSTFWNNLLIPKLKSKYHTEPVHSFEEIQLLKKRFPKNIRQFNVYQGEKLIAGTTIFEHLHIARSQYIASDENKNKLGSLDFLHFYLLENVFKDKILFDFGSSHTEEHNDIIDGLIYWKEGFGATSTVQKCYRVKTKNYYLLDTILK